MDVVKAFNSELVSLYEIKPPISKTKMIDITKSAMRSIKYYKHVVLGVEKFIQKCKPEYKVPGLYVIDSIVRQSRHQFGDDKDVFGARFAQNMLTTVKYLLTCPDNDKPKIVRVLNLWIKNGVFKHEIIAPLLEHCRNEGLEVEVMEVEKIVKGDAANPSIYGKEETPAGQHSSNEEDTPPRTSDTTMIDLTPITTTEPSSINISEHDLLECLKSSSLDPQLYSDPLLLRQIHNLTNSLLMREEFDHRRQGNIKSLLSQEFDYSDDSGDDDTYRKAPVKAKSPPKPSVTKVTDELLRNPSVIVQIQQLYQQQRLLQQHHQQRMNASAAPNMMQARNLTMPSIANINAFNPDYINRGGGIVQSSVQQEQHVRDDRPRLYHGTNDTTTINRHSQKGGNSDRDRSPIRDRKRSKHSRSRDRDESSRRGDETSSDDRNNRKSSSKHHAAQSSTIERERRRLGLPTSPRSGHAVIASRTLWLGRIPSNCSDDDIKSALSVVGIPEKINIILPRACAYVTMTDRRSAFKVIDKMQNSLVVARKNVKLGWASGQGLKSDKYTRYWDGDKGVSQIPYDQLTDDIEQLSIGGHVDVDTLPDSLRDRYLEMHKLRENSKVMDTTKSFDNNAAAGNIGQYAPFPFALPPGFPFVPPPFNLPPPTMGFIGGATLPIPGDIPLPGQSTPASAAAAAMPNYNPPTHMIANQPPVAATHHQQQPGAVIGVQPQMPYRPRFFSPQSSSYDSRNRAPAPYSNNSSSSTWNPHSQFTGSSSSGYHGSNTQRGRSSQDINRDLTHGSNSTNYNNSRTNYNRSESNHNSSSTAPAAVFDHRMLTHETGGVQQMMTDAGAAPK